MLLTLGQIYKHAQKHENNVLTLSICYSCKDTTLQHIYRFTIFLKVRFAILALYFTPPYDVKIVIGLAFVNHSFNNRHS